ncbi:YebC/PmpR family DNA-binding transcriptional regulator [Streptococcus alactolyticus]|jgi:YebC/PmpR family DNA-binding regulatory protein|uniref:YebC/PmpR family DNA-binding transcriptional regulator n=1 Tax=Streptococcus alactolyticus TaxID=29389 RepID=UPI001F384CD4|nr:YebC/PmpR family DNA-binding transcriptional regulator [Streptococcus alactolyticus]MDE2587618.1 YebC/PmpR family DNA-binding transcriptional regulator [Lactobacillales bacterium]MCF2665656.1 YebC/PmpR family DNA-binding transcriptional regulator [Streptococcus alactolyticus]MCF2678038.1 YebC/PmpR family DNA-binding transcriptional regulator [Streptococcus alactolyticus]MCI6905195.1 YebC/PmpR family DNA-binding transcriptional regulator [Streptococcus alactolyticus]MDY5187632.1 YebC/PmpR fa
MSGHNKWSKIKNKKGEADAKRGAVFNKLSREIFVAAKAGGGDPAMNASLRMVLDKARAANMPKDNINRAIKKATDVGDTTNYDEITYEGYGPGGVAILVHTLTDNKKRTDANLHTIFTRNGGNMGSTGSVAYMFDRKGYLVIEREGLDLSEDDMLGMILEAGADDLKTTNDVFEILTEPKAFPEVKEALQAQNLTFAHAQLSMIPQNYVSLDEEQAAILEKLVDKLEDDDDVQDVYTNMAED